MKESVVQGFEHVLKNVLKYGNPHNFRDNLLIAESYRSHEIKTLEEKKNDINSNSFIPETRPC